MKSNYVTKGKGEHGIYKKFKCVNKGHKDFSYQKHQDKVKQFFIYGKERKKGLLLFHELGSGKTCTSIIIADEMIQKKMIEKVYILVPGSLTQGWFKEYCDVCGLGYLKKYFIFVTYNYGHEKQLKQIEDIDFNNSLVIIDEVHNFINSVKNQYEKSF